MGQRGTTGAADGTAVTGATTEFEPDVTDLFVKTLRRAVGRELSSVGTDTLLGELVSGDTDAGETIAPGIRKAGSLSGSIMRPGGPGLGERRRSTRCADRRRCGSRSGCCRRARGGRRLA